MNAIEFFKKGVAFLPKNVEHVGDVVVIYGKSGEKEVLNISARSYLIQLTRFFGVDLSVIRQRYGQAISKKQMIPLPFAANWTLVPVQIRRPIGRQQTYGWIVMQAIEDLGTIKESPNKSLLYVKGNHTIPVFHSNAGMRRIIREVQLVELHYQLLHQTPEWVKESRSRYLYF